MAVTTLDQTVKYCGVNTVLCELTYNGTVRLCEVYSYRIAKNGNALLYAFDIEAGRTKSFTINNIEHIKATETKFVPRFPIEFT